MLMAFNVGTVQYCKRSANRVADFIAPKELFHFMEINSVILDLSVWCGRAVISVGLGFSCIICLYSLPLLTKWSFLGESGSS